MNNSRSSDPKEQVTRPILVDFSLESEVISSLALRLGEEEGLALPSLSERDFVFPETRALFKLIKRMLKFGEPFDVEALTTRALSEGLEKTKALEILASSPDPFQLPRQVEKLKALTRKRKIHELTQKLAMGKLSENYFFQAMERYHKLSTAQAGNKEKLASLLRAPEIDERAQVEFVVPELIPRGYLTWLVGYPKVGKSWVSLRLACDVSVGGSILDGVSYTPAPQRVLYILGDTGPAQPMSRLKRTRWHYNPETLRFIYLSELTEQGLDLDFSKPEGQSTLETLIKLASPDLVVLDSFSSLVGSDLNKEAEAKPLALYLNQLSQKFNIGLLVLYHSRKPPKNLEGAKLTQHDVSGSGVLTRFSGITIGVEEREDRKTGEKIHLVRYLGGWVREFPAFSFRLVDDVDEQTDDEIVRMEIDRNPTGKNWREIVLEQVRARFPNRWFTRQELMQEIPNAPEEWLRKVLGDLVKQGILLRDGITKNAKYALSNTQTLPNHPETRITQGLGFGRVYFQGTPKSSIWEGKNTPSQITLPNPNPHGKRLPDGFGSTCVFCDDLGGSSETPSQIDPPTIGGETKNHFSPYIPKRDKKTSGVL